MLFARIGRLIEVALAKDLDPLGRISILDGDHLAKVEHIYRLSDLGDSRTVVLVVNSSIDQETVVDDNHETQIPT